jgi:hypothetical protein
VFHCDKPLRLIPIKYGKEQPQPKVRHLIIFFVPCKLTTLNEAKAQLSSLYIDNITLSVPTCFDPPRTVIREPVPSKLVL